MSNTIFWIQFDISFLKPVLDKEFEILFEPISNVVEGSPDPFYVYGYITIFGVTHDDYEKAISEAKSSLLEEDKFLHYIEHKINVTYLSIIEHKELQQEIYDDDEINEFLIQDPKLPGVYYRSARAFYWDDEED